MRSVLIPLILLFFLRSNAQLCSGGLGDPIIHYTFGAGTDTYGPQLAAGVTNLNYVKTTCPEGGDVGSYSIVHGPGTNCFTGDWINFTSDHTGDPNGYIMLINASNPPSDFYVQTVNGLCPSTSYQFGAWVLNMASHLGEIPPNITFSIENTDGTVIKSFQTGDLPVTNPVKWNQYSFYFTTPAGVSSVVLRMRNNAPGGYGNDLALDDITFRTSGPSVSISIAGYAGNSAVLCSDPTMNLQLNGTVASCYASTSCQWQVSNDNGVSWGDIAGAGNLTYSSSTSAAGKFLYRLVAAQTGNLGNSSCQVASAPDSVVVLKTTSPSVTITLDPDHPCIDSPASFTAIPTDGGSQPVYQWMVDGSPVGTNSDVYASSTLGDGSQIKCTMVGNGLCMANPSATSNTITLQRTPAVNSSVSIQTSANDICHDSVVIFTASAVNAGSKPSFEWLLNDRPVGKDSVAYVSGDLNNGDVVSVILNTGLRCDVPARSNAIPMTVYDIPHLRVLADTVIAGGSYAVLNASVTGPFEFSLWTPGKDLSDPTVLRPVASPRSTTVYQITVSNSKCSVAATEKVEVFYDLFMPNAFTPNGDGINDLFRIPPSIDLKIMQFSIYNRLGGRVFTTVSSSEGWDGRLNDQPQPSDTYVWAITYFNPILKKTMMKKGTVELIR